MNRPKIVVVWATDVIVSRLHELLLPHQFDIVQSKTGNEEEIKALLGDAEFLLVRRGPKINQDIITAGRRLKLIQVDGPDGIDAQAAKKAGVPVIVLSMALDMQVAEHAIMLMLALCKKLVTAHQAVVNGEYQKLNLRPLSTTETTYMHNWMNFTGLNFLYRKTLGIIGLGTIGREVAKRARSFQMRILYFKRHRLPSNEEHKLGVQYAPFRELLKEADFVTLHIPHTKETDRIMGRKEFSLMKPTAFFVNVSRGGVVDEAALYHALKNNVIAGAGIDVFREEPTPKDNPILRLENVIVTPHIAGTMDAFYYDSKQIADNILSTVRTKRSL